MSHLRTATPEHGYGTGSPRRLKAVFLTSVAALASRCAKQASRVSKKLKAAKPSSSNWRIEPKSPSSPLGLGEPKSPLSKPKQLITSISNKAINFMQHKKKTMGDGSPSGSEEWGDGGVWQRAILMGDKCEPLDFSGVIYYDSHGNQLNEVPLKSPRASPLPGYLQRMNK
ncbi:hypothetical protein FNV43_RR20076 [Rhamnella rubrinervis]|uniref:Uncharacterized protein n=1 Tax=Rhamnella rubrinervis TaxID=2594499 RepID=A0A8K0GU92_9ROSA|nr:hypothetical protein FNV43_RR20076 [Rhamnella rubrinervis]